MSEKITKKQKLILDFIAEFMETHDYSPSYREIMAGVGLSSVSAVAEHVENLAEKGVLKKTPGAARSLEIVGNQHPETVALFNRAIEEAESEAEIEILLKAAGILGLDLEM